VYVTKKKYFHSLESDSARNNIHPNNKQKPEITKENTRKITYEYGQQVWAQSRQIFGFYSVQSFIVFQEVMHAEIAGGI